MYTAMRKRLFCFIVLILSIETYGQHSPCFFKQSNSPINIYESDCSMTPFAVINQDSILENYYSVEIMNSTMQSHLVRIMCAASSSKALIEGWVEKRICNVWLWTMEQGNYIFIYEEPIQSSHYVKVDLTEYSSIAVPVLNISKDGWYYISIPNGEYSLFGWTKNVCTNIWGSCEHGNPYSKKLQP